MKILEGVVMPDHPVCKPALRACDRLWAENGQPEGVTITAGKESTKTHSAASWHWFGAAFDVRTRYFDEETKKKVFEQLKSELPGYDVIWHSTHIHIEPGDELARTWGLLL